MLKFVFLFLFVSTFVSAKIQDDLPSSSIPVVQKIALPGFVDWMGVGFGSVWAPSSGKLHRIEPESGEIIAQIPIGNGSYRGVALGLGFVWIMDTGNSKLYKIDPTKNQVSAVFPVPNGKSSEGSIGVGPSSVWLVSHQNGQTGDILNQVDPDDGHLISTVNLPGDCNGVVSDGADIWVSSGSGNSLVHVDAKTSKIVAQVPVGLHPRFIAYGEGSVWSLNQGDGKISRVDVKTNLLAATIDIQSPGGGGGIAFGEGGVWATVFDVPVSKVDPVTNLKTVSYHGYVGGDAIQAGLGYVWLSIHAGQIWKIQP